LQYPALYELIPGLSPDIGPMKNFYTYVPQMPGSRLQIATLTLPTATQGVPYSFRLQTRHAVSTTRWTLTNNYLYCKLLPTGLRLIASGSKAGTITGVPRNVSKWLHHCDESSGNGAFDIDINWIMVRDKVGHTVVAFVSFVLVS
jgi:hypothetical protein